MESVALKLSSSETLPDDLQGLDSRSFGYLRCCTDRDSSTSENVEDCLRKAIRKFQHELSSSPEGSSSKCAILCRLGHFHLLLEEYTNALSAYLHYQSLNQTSLDDPCVFYGLGIIYFHLKSYQQAVQSLHKVLHLAPSFERAADVHLRLGAICKRNGEFKTALDHFQIVLKDPGPTQVQAQYYIAHIYQLQGHYSAAKQTYENILEMKYLTSEMKACALRQLGWLYHQHPATAEGNPNKAQAMLEMATQTDPLCGQSWYYLGRCHADNGRVHDAFLAYQQSVQRSGHNADTWCSIGILYQSMHQSMDSLHSYIAAVYLDVQHFLAWTNLACLYESMMQPIDALLCYKNALDSCKSSSSGTVLERVHHRLSILEPYVRELYPEITSQPNTLPTLSEAWSTFVPLSVLNKRPPPTRSPVLYYTLSPTKFSAKGDIIMKKPTMSQEWFSPSSDSSALPPDSVVDKKPLLNFDAPSMPGGSADFTPWPRKNGVKSEQLPVADPSPEGLKESLTKAEASTEHKIKSNCMGLEQRTDTRSSLYCNGTTNRTEVPAALPLVSHNAVGRLMSTSLTSVSPSSTAHSSEAMSPFRHQICPISVASSSPGSLIAELPRISVSSSTLPCASHTPSITMTSASNSFSSKSGSSSSQQLAICSIGVSSCYVGGTCTAQHCAVDRQAQQFPPVSLYQSSLKTCGSLQAHHSGKSFHPVKNDICGQSLCLLHSSKPSHVESRDLANQASLSHIGDYINRYLNEVANSRTTANRPGEESTDIGQLLDDTSIDFEGTQTIEALVGQSGKANRSYYKESDPLVSKNHAHMRVPDSTEDSSSGISSIRTKLSTSSIDHNFPNEPFTPSASASTPTPLTTPSDSSPSDDPSFCYPHSGLITPLPQPYPSLGEEAEYMLNNPLRPPCQPACDASVDSLHPSCPIFQVSIDDDDVFLKLHSFCTNPSLPICLIKGLCSSVDFDLEKFSTETLVKTNPDHEMEIREQVLQAPDENWDPTFRKQVWRCESERSEMRIHEYAEYQTSVLRELQEEARSNDGNTASTRKRKKKQLKFGTNVDLSDKSRWHAQLTEIEKLPRFLQVTCPEANLLNHVGHTILGMNTVQLYMKVPGCRTPGHQENNNFCSVNINIGPGQCEWFAVHNKYWGAVHTLCEKHKLSFLVGSWWPILEELKYHNIPVYRFTQHKGEVVWINPGTVHWVQATGVCNNIAWNSGPITAHQFRMAWERYLWNKIQNVRSIVPMVHLSWNLARRVQCTDRSLINLLKDILESSYNHCQALLSSLKKANIPVTWHGQVKGENSPCCANCLNEVFNILFVANRDNQYIVFCNTCARSLRKQHTPMSVLQQYSMEELEETLRQLVYPVEHKDELSEAIT